MKNAKQALPCISCGDAPSDPDTGTYDGSCRDCYETNEIDSHTEGAHANYSRAACPCCRDEAREATFAELA